MKPSPSIKADWSIAGELVAFPTKDKTHPRMLDGFYHPASNPHAPLLIFVHGMGSNFYRSALKKTFLKTAAQHNCAILSFNNRGAEQGTADEPFRMCLSDLDAALDFAKRRGHRKVVLVGHSTGCQKIVFWQAQRKSTAVAGLVLLAPADDYAITKQTLGSRFEKKVAWAQHQVARKNPSALITGLYEKFTAKRFISIADPRHPEATIFRYAGSLTHYRRVKCPLFAIFGEQEEFAIIPPADMLALLRENSKSKKYSDWLVPAGDHGFHGVENDVATAVLRWIQKVAPCD